MIKILCVVREVLPVPGGYSIRGENIFNELSKYYDTRVIVANYSNREEYIKYNFVKDNVTYKICKLPRYLSKNKIIGIPNSGILLRYFKRKYFMQFIDEYIKNNKPSVIIGHTPADVAIAALMVAKKHNIPFIFDIRQFHFLSNSRKYSYLYEKKMYKKIVSESYAFAVISNSTKKILKMLSYNIYNKPIELIPNGIHLKKSTNYYKDEITDLKNSLKLKKIVIGYIGTVSEYEGLDLLVDAFNDLNLTEISLLIVGDGPFYNELRKIVIQYNNSDIRIIGRVNYNKVDKYYELIDLFVIPRISTKITESVTPLKPFEIIQHKKPILCSSVGGLTELIQDGKNGFIFKKGNKDDLISKLEYILKNKNETKKVVNNALNWLQAEYTWDKIGKSYIKLIQKVSDKREIH